MTQNLEIIKLLKRGASTQEIDSFISEQRKQAYAQDFTTFMNEMIEKKHLKRKDIPARTGLSQDYTYKLLRGDKKTNERDYVLAMCIALEMNIAETQHALEIYPMPTLSFSDIRSQIIYHAIEGHLDIHRLNELLEKSGFPYIRVSPDMPHADIEYNAPIEFATFSKANNLNGKKTYKVINEEIVAEHIGHAPTDYCYSGTKVVEDAEGDQFFVSAHYSPMGDIFVVLEDPEAEEALEEYERFEDTFDSEFFPFFLQIDRDTDKKVLETLEEIDDTRNYGMRLGMGFHGGKREMYIEVFNQTTPAEKEYLQVVDVDGDITYSASRESYFLRYELGQLYEPYFGKDDDPAYYVCVKSYDELPQKYAHYKFIFEELKHELHKRLAEEENPFIDDIKADLVNEEITILAQRATAAHRSGSHVEGLSLLNELLEKQEKHPRENYVGILHTYNKIAITKGLLSDYNGMFETYKEILELSKDAVNIEMSEEEQRSCNVIVGDAALYLAQAMQNMGRTEDAFNYIQQSLAYLEGNCEEFSDWVSLYQAYAKYAFMIEDDPEESVEYSRKAIDVVRDHDIGHDSTYIEPIAILYNNHAHALWNDLGSEESIIYYGMAIELLEGAFTKGNITPDKAKGLLEHVGKALNNIYRATNREKESERLIHRLSRKNVIL